MRSSAGLARRPIRWFTPGGFVMLVVCVSLASSEAVWGQSTTRVSLTNTGNQSTGGFSSGAAISADGRFVAFESASTNLVASDSNGLVDIFLRDRTNGTTTRVSVPNSGFQATGGDSRDTDISADGQFVAFDSTATNLVANDSNGLRDVFVRDRTNGTTTRVSVPNSGFQATGGDSHDPAISADGRFVAFYSSATNLVAGDSNGRTDVFVRDRTDGSTTRVSLTSTGTQSTNTSHSPDISDDGRFVSFTSLAPNLVAGDTNAENDVFVRDRTGATTTRVSVTSTGTQAVGEINLFDSKLSADGQFVVWTSEATNLVAGDSNALGDVFLRDRTGATTTRESVTSTGTQATGGGAHFADISGDERIVVFGSQATNLVAGDSNGFLDVFARDRNAATTSRVSVTNTGNQATGGSSVLPAISADGRFVAFESHATNLVAGDSNGQKDIFVRDRGAFGRRTRVTLSLARKRIPARGPLRVRVRNRNRFAVYVRLSGRTVRRVSRGGRKRRVRLRTRSFNVNGRARRTVRLRLPRAVRRLLRRRRKVSLRLTARVTGPAGKTRTVKKKVTPRLRKKRRR